MEGHDYDPNSPLLGGHCLLCLIKVEPGSPSSSFQQLANYLKLTRPSPVNNDPKKVNRRNQSLSQKVEVVDGDRSKLREWNVTLCEGCSLLGEKIWALHEQLEKVKLEMAICLNMVEEKVKAAEEAGLMTELFRNSKGKSKVKLESGRGRVNLFEDLEKLRKEVKEKCSMKLSRFPPQVQLQKITGAKSDLEGRGGSPEGDDDLFQVTDNFIEDHGYDVEINYDPDLGVGDDTTDDKLQPGASSPSNIGKRSSSSSSTFLPRSHKCNLCSKAYTTSKSLGKHRRMVHLKRRNYECRHCSKRFEFNYTLREHLRTIHSELLDPEQDGLQPGVSSEYSTVIMTTPKDTEAGTSLSLPPAQSVVTFNPATRRHDCPQCSNSFKTRQLFYYHYNSIHLNIRFQCTLCSQEFKFRRDYRRHHQVEHMNLTFTCHKCGQLFRKKSSFQAHLYKVKCEDGYGRGMRWRCQECDKKCRTEAALETHMKRDHLKLREYICQHCAKSFTSTRNMNKHISEIHTKATEYTCEICSKVFYRKDGLTRHLKAVHPDGPVVTTATTATTESTPVAMMIFID